MTTPSAKIISRKRLFDGFHKLDMITAEIGSLRPGGGSMTIAREVLCGPHVAMILLYNPATDEILMNKQFRIGAFVGGAEDPFLLECAAGCIDEGETPEQAAVREAREETGCEISELERIGACYSNPGNLNQKFHLFAGCIDQAAPGFHGHTEEGEDIETVLLPAKDVIAMLDNDEILQAPAALMLHWFARNHERLRKKWKSS